MKQAQLIDMAVGGQVVQPNSAAVPQTSISAVRSRGEIRLGFSYRAGATAISASYQGGCLKVRLPRTRRHDRPCAVLLNTSGGLAGGDSLVQRVDWGERTEAAVTTQAAEKIYRAIDAPATVSTRIEVGGGARAEWLPQESILFDRAWLSRDMQVRIAGDADFLGVEAVVLGRTAMGERVEAGSLVDRWRIWRDGRLIYADALRLEGEIDALMRRPAIGAGARAMAVAILAAPRAPAVLGALREALEGARGQAAASSWNGMTAVRLLAADGSALRHDLLRALAVLREGRALPRVWSC